MNERFGDRAGENSLAYFLDKALKNSEQREGEARRLANTDSLTGLFNRLVLDEQLPEIIKRLSREGGERESDPDYVLFFLADVNRFKFLDDTYGHPKGDEALRAVARRFEEEARGREGKAIRFGGDEFAIIQEGKGNLTDDEVKSISSRIQAKINSGLSVPVPNGKFDITVSMGYAILRKGELKKDAKNPKGNIEEAAILIKEADDRMYAYKRANGVERGK